ncbi:MAG TPA: DUF1835 domain-containing protein [Gammaproteobacteria bacterium]|nr:DUF1835 domain-containing protein [Gammaproteobacteria bacterium]
MNYPIKSIANILHITNDAAMVKNLAASFPGNDFLAWEDALYEGPINTEMDLAQLSDMRANFFSERGGLAREEIRQRYQTRNTQLLAYQEYAEVVLWFDKDLNSQLQLIQLIEWFSRQKMANTILSLISFETMAKEPAYFGLAMLTSHQLQTLMSKRWEVTWGQMSLCQQAWHALGSENPNALVRLCDVNTAMMPYMKNAILRFLRQFPSQANGLSHSEFLISHALLRQQHELNDVYLVMQAKEGTPFVNQAIYCSYLQNMCSGELPMIEQQSIDNEDLLEDEVVVELKMMLKLTDLGRQVLHNWVDWVQVRGINRWLGGAQLSEGNLWRYDQTRRRLIKTYV